MNCGDVVLVTFPFEDKPGAKIRPALVVQSDAENRRHANTIVAMITGNLSDQNQPTTLLLDPSTPLTAGCGLHGRSLLKCSNLVTVRQHTIIHILGRLSHQAMALVDAGLKASLGVS